MTDSQHTLAPTATLADKILPLTPETTSMVLQRALEVVQAGGLVVFPTETVYGAGVDACNPAAVQKLLAYKSRREGKPLSIAVTGAEMAERYVELNDQARALYAQFLPGPLTVISRSRQAVAPGVESEFGTLGVRIPDYPFVLELVRQLGGPLTATSANASGEKRPYSITDIIERLSDKQLSLLDLVIDAGTLPPNPPSTVIDTTLATPLVVRAGELSLPGTQLDSYSLSSASEAETQELAGRLMLKHWNAVGTTGLVIGLIGELGVGKTIFAKGVAHFLGLTEPITSPTYTYIQEYPFTRHQTSGTLYHLDVWKVDSPEQFALLEVERLLRPGNVVVIEWVNQVADSLERLLQAHPTPYIEVQLSETATGRSLSVKEHVHAS